MTHECVPPRPIPSRPRAGTTSTRHDATTEIDRDRPRWTSTRRRWRRRRTSRPIASVSVAEEDVDDGINTIISDIIVARRGGRRLDAARGRWSFVDYRAVAHARIVRGGARADGFHANEAFEWMDYAGTQAAADGA